MRYSKRLMLTLAVASLFAATASAVPVFTENFETVATGAGVTGALGGFTVTSGSVDVLGPTFLPAYCYGASAGGKCVDLNGSAGATIQSGLLTLAPGSYTLTFTMNGIPASLGVFTAGAMVSLGSAFSQSYSIASNSTNSFSQTFTVGSSTTANLTFAGTSPGAAGALLDNVNLDFTAAEVGGVPEPATMSMLSGGGLLLAGLAYLRRRKS